MTYTVEALLGVARGEVGVIEVPRGSNSGPRVRVYQSSTGAYHAPWCASFVQWCLKQVGAGPIAHRSAGVFYIANYARSHGWLRWKPKAGMLICYLDGEGHMGIIQSVSATAIFAIEGNHENSVQKVRRPLKGNYAFIEIPGEVKPKRWVWVPRFELVTGEGANPKVVIPWGKWSKVRARIPRALAKHRAAKIRRKLVKVRQ